MTHLSIIQVVHSMYTLYLSYVFLVVSAFYRKGMQCIKSHQECVTLTPFLRCLITGQYNVAHKH